MIRPSRHGQPWDFTDDKTLAAMTLRQEPLEDIAAELGRTVASVRERLNVLRAQGTLKKPRRGA